VPAAFDPASPNSTSSYATSTTAFDSLGTAHHAEIYFRNQGGGAWEWHAMVDGGELVGGTAGTPTEIASGALTFDTTGKLATQAIASSSANFTAAAPNQSIAFRFGDDIASGGTGLTGATQFSGPSSVHAVDVDGHSFGTLTDLTIAEDGAIQGVYDNGERIELARLALADFASYEGLERAGNGLWAETGASGNAFTDAPGTGARGAIVSGAVEASNVDLGSELVTLIAYQRAFQANAKTVTTADEMMADVNGLKR
jgi:flagellar hook protein FlgE